MNTSSLTAGSSRSGQAIVLRAQARRLEERIALRAGLALLAWGRRQEERRTHDAVSMRRRTEQAATRARNDEFRRLAVLGSPLI